MTDNIQDDLLEGAEQIALFLYGDSRKRRRVYRLSEKQQLPVFRWGDILMARKSTLLAHITAQERAAAAAPGGKAA